jgi:hypothetical protein
MTMNRHEPFEELISASLHGDLTADERARLDAHLDGCAECRATLAAFADQRRIMAGLRHVPPPRDLDARVRAGIEAVAVPWWRRPQVMFAGIGGGLAVVAGAILAIVLLNGRPDGPPVGQSSPTASAVVAPSTTPASTLPPASAAPSHASPSASAAPTETPAPASPEPDVFLALTGPVEDPSLSVRDGTTGDVITDADAPSGQPIAAELSPDGQWLAYITLVGESGMNEVRATRIAAAPPGATTDSPVAVGGTVSLGRTIAGSPFLDHLFWSPDGRYLAYTLSDVAGGGTDAWVFQPGIGEPSQLTNVGNAYAGSWTPDIAGTSLLWVSTAGEVPQSYLVPLHDDAGPIVAGDPADSPFRNAEDVFQPILSPDGALVIFWSGQMAVTHGEWLFSRGGQPWLAEVRADGAGGYEFASSREVFRDLTVGQDAFESAAVAWSDDSDAYAVWETAWTGVPQSSDGEYPDRGRIYFTHATDPRGMTQAHALDAADLPADAFVVDVKVSPTGRHLVVTAGQSRAGIGDPPHASLLLITRNTGTLADEVRSLGAAADGWFGPAAFDDVP